MKHRMFKLMHDGKAIAVSPEWMRIYNHAKRNNLKGTAQEFYCEPFVMDIIQKKGILV